MPLTRQGGVVMSVFIILLLTVQSHTKAQRDSQKPLIQLGLSCISQLHCVHRAKYLNDSNTFFFFFSIPLQLLNRCEALILGFLIGNKPFGLYPFLHVHFISSFFNVWFWKSCILPVLNIPQLSVSMTRFLWLLSTHILHSPHSVFCFHRRSVKSSSSKSTSFLEHLQWAIPSLVSQSLSTRPPFLTLCTASLQFITSGRDRCSTGPASGWPHLWDPSHGCISCGKSLRGSLVGI